MEAEDVEEEIKRYVDRVVGAFSELIESNPQVPSLPIPSHAAFLQNLDRNMRSIFQRIDAGVCAILNLVASLAKEEMYGFTREQIDELGQLVAVAAVIREHSSKFMDEMAEGKSLKELFGVTDETLDLLYRGAKYLYENQHYFEASTAFSILTLLDPRIHLFWMGLGTAEYLQERYEAALLAYAMAAQADSSDPLCHIYSAHSYLGLKENDKALQCLEIALLITDPHQVDIQARIKNQIAKLKGE